MEIGTSKQIPAKRSDNWRMIFPPLVVVACLFLIRDQYGVLLFHTLAELFSVSVGVLMLVIVWNTRRFTHNDFLIYLGIGYFWVAVLDVWHTFTVNGMPFLVITDSEVTLHFWIYSRLIEAFLLLTASLYLTRKLNANLMLLSGAALTVIVIWASLTLQQPIMLTAEGLTTFKIATEYFVILVLAVAAYIYIKKGDLLPPKVLYFLLASITLTICAELAFTLYTDFQGVPFAVGHLFKFLSFWMIYQAIVQTTLKEPFSLLALGSSSYEAIPHPAVVVDGHGVISQVNRAAEKVSGLPAEKLIHEAAHPIFHPTGIPQEQCKLCQALAHGESVSNLAVEFPKNKQWFLASLAPIQKGGTSNEMVLSLTDITEHKRTESLLQEKETHLRTLVETLPDLVWLKDPEGVYLSCNRKFERFFGAGQSEIVGKKDIDFLEQNFVDFLRKKDMEAMSSGKPCQNEQEITYADDGHREMLEVIKTPMFSNSGELIGVLGVGRDITNRKQNDKALRRAQKMDAIGQLTGGIAHDFNNILGIILGNLDLLEKQTTDDEKVQKRVTTITKSAQRAADLTRQLLGFSRNRAQQVSDTNINQMIADMDSLITRSLTPQIEVEHHLADDLWSTMIDPGDFQDALLNILLNARDAMPQGGKLTIESQNSTLDTTYCARNPDTIPGEYVELTVSDSGEGISESQQERIFEPFFTTKPQGKGTGLGLSMVFGFIKRSEGHIKVYSELGIGSTFRLYLPRSMGNTASPSASENSTIEQPVHSEGELILMVDDEVDLLELASASLKALGYRVLTATNGQLALEQLAQNPSIKLLFSDVVMPGGINGYELADQATQAYPALKVLLTSGYTERTMAHNGQVRFNAHLLSKPYSQADLALQVHKTLGSGPPEDRGNTV